MPAPTSRNSVACSNTSTSSPARLSVSAAASPPIPAPITMIRTSLLAASEEARIFDRGTSIHHDCQAGLLGAARCVEVDYPKLAPEDARTFGDGLLDNLRHELRASEHVHHLDGLGNRCEVRIALLAESTAQRVGIELRIYRNHFEAVALEQPCDFERVARRIVGASDYSDRGWPRQDLANLCVGRIAEFHNLMISRDNRPHKAMDFLATLREYLVALLVRIVDVARLARERAQREHRPLLGAGKSLDQLARLLLRHRDDEIGFLEHLGMPLEIGRSRFVADVDADFAQRHPRVERNERAITRIRRDARGLDRDVVVEAERVEFVSQYVLGHHAARRVGGADKQDGTKARLTRSRAFSFLLSRQESTRPRPSPRPCSPSW